MNYIKEINAFRNYLKTHPLEAITQALWYTIADYHNSCNWERWIFIDNTRLQADLQITEKTLIKHRNLLMQHGLLEYKSQQRKKNSGKYKLLSFELNEIKTAVKNTADRSAECTADRSAECTADRSDINKLNKTKQNNDYIKLDEQDTLQETSQLEENALKIVLDFYTQKSTKVMESGKDREEALALINDNIPVDIILKGIEQSAPNFKPKYKGEKMPLKYCKPAIYELFEREKTLRQGDGINANGNENYSRQDDQYKGIGISL
jgi:hypothetical protein